MSFPAPSEKQAKLMWLALSALALAVLLTLIGLVIFGFGRVLQILSPVLWPLAIAGAISSLLDPVVDGLARKGVPRPRAILCVFALATVVIAALFASILPQLARETRQLVERIPAYTTNLQTRVQTWINDPPELIRRFFVIPPRSEPGTPLPPSPSEAVENDAETNAVPAIIEETSPSRRSWSQVVDADTLQSAARTIANALPKVSSWFFGQASKVASWVGMLAGLALIPIYTFYFLLEKEGIQRRWTDYLPVARSDFKNELVFVIQSINDYLIVFFRGQVLVALCDGVLYTIGFYLIGLPYAFLLGVMATALTIIPFLGAIVTCVTALIIAFVQYGDWLHPALVLAVFGVVQTLEGLVISPKIMGDRVGLHPLTIIIAVMAGTTLMGGLLGGILAIPLTAALRVVMFRYVWNPADKTKQNSPRPVQVESS